MFDAQGRLVNEKHAYEMHANEVHPHEMHAREMHAHEVHAYEVHAHKVHAREVHAREIYAHEVYASEMIVSGLHRHRRYRRFLPMYNPMARAGRPPSLLARANCVRLPVHGALATPSVTRACLRDPAE